jgi:glycosyltransferase involved in cell wall biosynthesis
MDGAIALVFPSVWYEGFPVTIAESFARGLPAIASNLGAMSEIVKDQETGLLFEPSNAADLAAKAAWAWEQPQRVHCMALAARAYYEHNLTGERHCAQLVETYERAVSVSHERRQDQPFGR